MLPSDVITAAYTGHVLKIIIPTHYWNFFRRFEETFIKIHLKDATQHLWIGMNNKHGVRRYYWVDNSKSNYFNWNKGQPASGANRCVEIVSYRWPVGRWNSVYCSKLNGYICKKGLFKQK